MWSSGTGVEVFAPGGGQGSGFDAAGEAAFVGGRERGAGAVDHEQVDGRPAAQGVGDADEKVRFESILSLSMLGPAAAPATPALAAAMDDPVERIRDTAAPIALRRIGPAAVPRLAAILRDRDGPHRAQAVRALRMLPPDGQTFALLGEAARDGERWRLQACDPQFEGWSDARSEFDAFLTRLKAHENAEEAAYRRLK